jgi:hypothetical protein
MKPAECGITGLTIVTEQPEAMASMTTWPARRAEQRQVIGLP